LISAAGFSGNLSLIFVGFWLTGNGNRFTYPEIEHLIQFLRIPDPFWTKTRSKFSALELFCLLLYRFRSQEDLFGITSRFDRSTAALSEGINELVIWLNHKWSHVLEFDTKCLLHRDRLVEYANAFHRRGAPLQTVWGIIDCTIRAICRPTHWQRLMYSGHKKHHALKFQSIMVPNGMIAHLFGPEEGRRNDNHLLADSGLLERCEQHCFIEHDDGSRQYLHIYGDAAYGDRGTLLCPFATDPMSSEEENFNAEMSHVRIEVEHGYALVVNNWPFLNSTTRHRLFLSPVGAYYRVAVLLTNLLNCLHPNQVSLAFNVLPPTLEEYLHLD
jgi:hypothetical protein